MNTSSVHKALARLTERLEADAIPYAIVGGMALNQHGYRRVTVAVDVLLTPDGLSRFKERHLGRGYLEQFPGSRGMRDTVEDVKIDVLLTGDFPGDGKPKPVAFANPTDVATRGQDCMVVNLPTLVEMKLASGLDLIHRLKDLADVVELIRAVDVPRELVEQLDPWVRDKFLELWDGAQSGLGDEY